MNAPIIAATILIFAVKTVKSQSDRNWINFRSSAVSICLTPAHGVFLATRVGEVATPGDQPGTWREANPENGHGFLSEPLIDNINFFNNDTGFVSGFIQDGKSRYDIYYRTTDGGQHWEKRHFPDPGWVDEAVHLNNGKAWASVSGSGHIDYSTDYGLTWQQISVPHPQERYASIFFNDQGEGLIGSLWNVIAYTVDNGRTWRDLPTPLSQHAYQKTNIGARPEINKVAVFSSFLLVEQEGQLFVTAKDNIYWKRLPYDGFVADNNSSTLFFTKGSRVIRAGRDLSPAATYTIKTLPRASGYNNGQLAIWTGGELTTIDRDGAIASTPLYSSDSKVRNPVAIGFDFTEGSIGYMGGKLYTQKDFDSDWVYKETLPFPVQDRPLQMVGRDTLLVTGPGDSLLYFNLRTRKSTHTTATALLTGFCSQSVQKVVFETGSQGCFHYYTNNIVYERKGNTFELQDNAAIGGEDKDHLTGYPDEFPASALDSFVHQLPAALRVLPTIHSIGIDARDYDRCRRDILKFQAYVKAGKPNRDNREKGFWLSQNNIDFGRLLSLTDSVASMQPETIDSLLYHTSTMWSTTINWTGVQLIGKNGETLLVRNEYYEPNSLHFPWIVSVSGYQIAKNIVSVNQFIDMVYPHFFDNNSHADIMECFVKYLYGH